MLYECHITVLLKDREIAEQVAKDLHWKTSAIDGDPVLGKDTYFYLTTYGKHVMYNVQDEDIWHNMKSTVNVLAARGVKVIREKIELIVHDLRY